MFFKKLFAKKNDGFYLQVEDDKATPEQEPKAKAKAEPVTVTAPAAAVASTTEAPAAAAETKADTKADKKASKKSAKKAEAPKVVEAAAPLAPVAPAPVAPTTTFAPDYLIKPSSISRRRMPGANMNGFLDMARQTKKPVNIK